MGKSAVDALTIPYPAAPASPLRRRLLLAGASLGATLGAGLASGCSVLRAPGASTGAARHTAVPFSTAAAGGLPEGWQLHITRPDRPVTRYALEDHDGRTVLHAQADSATSGVRCDVNVDLQQTPWLRWEWRVDSFPAEATATDDALDDSPARIVLGFGGDQRRLSLRDRLFADQVELFTGQPLPFATLCYQWDGLAAPEQVLPYARSSRIRYLVVESGQAACGRWHAYRRNVAADYLRVFGEAPGPLTGIGLLTDSDDLKSHSEAWFGDLVIE